MHAGASGHNGGEKGNVLIVIVLLSITGHTLFHAAGRTEDGIAATPPVVGRQVLPLHRPRRDPRHAHANANARIQHRLHLRIPTLVLGPRLSPSGPPAATPPTATAAALQEPTRHGSKASTPRLVASLPTHHTSVPRSPSSSTQVGVLVSCAASQSTRTERR